MKKIAEVDDFVEHVCLMLAPLGEVRPKRMFGGYGIYVDDVFMAIIAYDTLWFKVDDGNVEDYREAQSRPFKPWEDRGTVMSYWEEPADVVDDRVAIVAWGGKALAAARRSGTVRKTRPGKPPARR